MLAREFPVRVRLRQQVVERVLVPLLHHARRHHLLREHVQRPRRDMQRVQRAVLDAPQQRDRLHEFVTRQWEETPLRRAAEEVPRPPDTLQRDADVARRPDLADEVDVADVYPQLQRRARHAHPHAPFLQPLLRVVPRLPRQAPVMRRHVLIAEPVRQQVRDTLHEAARVHEHERRPVLLRQLHHLVKRLRPLLMRRDGPQLEVARQLDGNVHRSPVPRIHDLTVPRRSRTLHCRSRTLHRRSRILLRRSCGGRNLAATAGWGRACHVERSRNISRGERPGVRSVP